MCPWYFIYEYVSANIEGATIDEKLADGAFRSMVLLRHRVGPGSRREGQAQATDHFDWLFDVGDDEELLAMATSLLPSPLPPMCDAVRLPPHRRRYLNYEGEISGDRGTVERLAMAEYRFAEQFGDAANRSIRVVEFRDWRSPVLSDPATITFQLAKQ